MSNLELNCKWHFDKESGREDGPNDPMQENFKKNPYASLIRESIQNSLDASLDKTKPVRMVFSISRIRLKEYKNFFGLEQHIKGCIKHFPKNDDAKREYQEMIEYFDSMDERSDLNYIKVSDYNTYGMDYLKGDTSLPFYAFVRAAGVSSKNSKSAGGSYGYGKAAFFYISPIRTILVSTMTETHKQLFEGVSSLCTHEYKNDNDLHAAVGYYDNNEGWPVTNPENIPLRFQRSEPGTDIYIMGINTTDKDSIYHDMFEAVLLNFWMAIIEKHLIVKIGEQEITNENIISFMKEYFPDDNDTVPREKKYNPRPYLDAVINANSNDTHYVFFEDQLPTIGHVRFYAKKVKHTNDKILYMRRPLMLVKARRTQSSNGFYGVFVCDDKEGNEYLRETENPAHNEWEQGNWRENGKAVQKGRDAINDVEKFIINVMQKMFSSKNNGALYIQGLDELLYIPTDLETELDSENDSLIGNILDNDQDKGNSISTTLSDLNSNSFNRVNNPSIGKVMINNPNSSPKVNDDAGQELGGHSSNHRKTNNKTNISYEDINERFKNSDTDDGIDTNLLHEIPVRYRSFAQIEKGSIIHTLVIHSDKEYYNCRIDLIIGGEQSDEKISIKECTPFGMIKKNSISNVHFKAGSNAMKIKFADNMKHAIKLEAYEPK